MKNLKSALKVFFSYILVLIIFVIFVPIVMNIGKDNFSNILAGYSIITFLILFSMVFSDTKGIALKERRPTSEVKGYPLKGFLLGIMAFSPFMLMGLVYPFIRVNSEAFNRVKHVVLNTILAPFYFLLKAGNESVGVYVAAFFIVPLIAGIGYFFGFKGYELKHFFKKPISQNTKK